MDFTLMLLRSHLRSLCLLLLVAGFTLNGFALSWFPFGPDGGDARAFAPDPRDHNHLYLGTVDGWIYESYNGGELWKRLARLGHRDDLAVDNIVVDPLDSKHIFAAAWVLGGKDGALYVSKDGGQSWTSNPEMKGQSIRALAIAPSDAKTLVAGTIEGVFRSTDGGEHWARISPSGSNELHEVESIAIDPVNPQTIYAGTWHLPWKTTDGGEHWNNIKQGIIDDSDVFSIVVDPKQPQVVYASACSGIYKSDNAGEKFVKVQGIPSTARRTRVLMQDPEHLATVFAGTTEGLYRTDDAGTYWSQATSSDLIVNDVYVDPTDSRHVLLATDHGGVLASHDGGVSFLGSNAGFAARQVTALVEDAHRPSDLYLGVVNDKQYGGAFLSENGGLSWVQHASGLDGRDVFSLGQAANGTIVAGTEHGIYWYDKQEQQWKRTGGIGAAVVEERSGAVRRGASKAHAVAKRGAAQPARQIEGSVTALALIVDSLWAVTSEGVYSSEDPSGLWHPVEGVDGGPWRWIANSRGVTMLASLTSIAVSVDAGKSWRTVQLPAKLAQVGAIAVDDQDELWVGGREGVFLSMDRGTSWTTLNGLNVSDVNSIYFDGRQGRVLITANASTTMAFGVSLANKAVKYWDTGWNLRFMRPVGDYLIGATLFDGIVVQPRMVQSK
jgi:photosystem II stability/assembly factor-like uncharacterized protein